MDFSKVILISIGEEVLEVFFWRIFKGITAGDRHQMDGSFCIF